MKKLLAIALVAFLLPFTASTQFSPDTFGKGLKFEGKDNSFFLKLGLRFQNLASFSWQDSEDGFDHTESNLQVRRSRIKADGWALSPKIKYKLELSLSNRDAAGGNEPEFGNSANIILDAHVTWNFYKNLSIQFGQGKLPGNRERVISSGSLQLVDRSRLNSRFTLDRDVGIQLKNHHKIGENVVIREVIAISQGEGKNITAGTFDGWGYTFRAEILPFGEFQSKGDYVGSAMVWEEKPKLSIGLTYDINQNAVRTRGQKGSFIKDSEGQYHGSDLTSFQADLMFKYKRFSLMAEYADRDAVTNVIRDEADNILGTYYTGSAYNVQAGYFVAKGWEVALRATHVTPDDVAGRVEDQYTLGLSRFVVGHKLKVQTDVTYRDIQNGTNEIFWRLQTEVHL